MSALTSRERVRLVLNHQEPDRIAIDLGGYQSGISYETYIPLKQSLGIDTPTVIVEPIQGLAKVDDEVLRLFGVDTRYIFPKTPRGWDGTVAEDGYFMDKFGMRWQHSFRDEWGVKWHRPVSSHYYDMVERRLEQVTTMEGLDTYPWPDPAAEGRVDGLKEEIDHLFSETECAIFTSGQGIFELTWQCYGMENFFFAMADDLPFIKKLLDKSAEALAGLYGKFLDVTGPYLDCMELYSDYGTQLGPLISPKFYREVIKPRDMELNSFLKSKTNAKICLHSCGSVYAFLPDLIEAGFEVLNPIQTTATGMNSARLKREFGKDLVFWGAIDTQKVLPFGTPLDVEREVEEKIRELGVGGGYIVASCHNIQAQTPVANVTTMFEAAQKYGQYPLNKA